MKDLSMDFLIDQVQAWKNIWQEAAIQAASLPAEARQIIMRKTADPMEALQELVPIIAGMHPAVIDFTLAALDTAAAGLGRLRDDTRRPDDEEADVTTSTLSIEERLERLETIVLGMGAVTHPLRN